jgi:carbamoyltransferase
MKVLGVNVGYSQSKEVTPDGRRHPLSDGSAALLDDGRLVFAGIEERHTRRRYEGGFGNAVCAFWGCDKEDPIYPVDVVAISSCCGPRWSSDSQVEEEIEDFLPPGIWKQACGEYPRLLVVDHHESHAALSFSLSGAKKALVAVIDGFGNLIEPDGWNAAEWWRGRFQRHSYYLAENVPGGFSLNCVARDSDDMDDVGLGEAYRALTHFCGWNSYQQAGSAMALAAFGDSKRFSDIPFIQTESGRIHCNISNDHPNPVGALTALLAKHGHVVASLRGRTATPEDSDYCDVARAMQDQLVEAICARILALAGQYSIQTVVVAGGVAMNCLAMGELQRRFDGEIFVPPAPSDTGQGLGNAIWASACTSSPCFSKDQSAMELPEAPFWGVPCNGVSKAVRRIKKSEDFIVTDNILETDQYKDAAQMLADGKLIAICMGRSEYGPRALGGRSILYDPRRKDAPLIVNQFKKRESYRPFAPAVLEEAMSDFFSWKVHSPFMSFAVQVKPSVREIIPGVIHADGTSRVQTVGSKSTSPLRPILEYFSDLTGIPMLLNTSFNRKGEPMVQTPFEAVDAFLHSTLDALFLDGITIQRKYNQ